MAQMKYFYELTISSSPHAHSPVTTQTIMRDVLIALVPALLGSIYFFGFRALLVTLVSAAACVFFEWGFCKIRKLHCKTYDLSAVVTGVLLAFVCPVTIPYWTIILGDFFAIVLVKMLFGGLGKNIVNPALAGRAFLFSWPVLMSNWVKVGFDNAAGLLSTADAVTAATPMSAMHQGALPEESILDMFLGNIGGCIGETSALLLIIGFIYLLYRKVITARIPLAYIGTVAILAFLFPQGNDRIAWMAAQVFGGGLMLGAIFMATDYVTSPLTKLGQIVYGIGCGVITILIRYFGGYSEGVTYAILCMNACAVLLDKIGRPVKFGAPKKEAAKK
ncbi:MAG: RnfABCDGE type electron transport complex subunit D [Oscillospiraceae bacterium]|jgi:electron transport complex, rnfABCDGE type, D subunit|nr:RnfABCDGE type electron transport complex subunit D [Oscillospiraceae bacterium]MEE0718369.1 RnfABCDGE type electron transport complex subunit D [Oscillospiraceae bacterium]